MIPAHIIVDFEFNPTSSTVHKRHLKKEIVEIGAVKLDSNFSIIDHFFCYVKPECHTHIEKRITQLTGIQMADVINAPVFRESIAVFQEWIGTDDARFYSWSDNDLRQLHQECNYKVVPVPYYCHWIDLQRIYPRMLCIPSHSPLALRDAARASGIPFDSKRAHNALYDAETTTQLLIPLLDGTYRKSAVLTRNTLVDRNSHSTISLDDASGGKLSVLLRRLHNSNELSVF